MHRLTQKQRLQVAQRNITKPITIPAPIKGWNTRDALDAMDPLDAIQLDNFFADAGGVSVRNGYTTYATGVGAAAVQTLAEFNAGATRKFLAAASGAIYDISASGAAGAPLKSGFTSNLWQTASFNSRLFWMNGSDTQQVYNGSTVVDSTFTGVTLSTLVGGIAYQQRLFFWAINSTGFWYAPLNSITGALAFFDLASFCPNGGNLFAAATFSHDGGNGVQDFIAFMMTSGDCLVYFGNDPAQAANWQQIGHYRISPPVSPRAVCNYGAEAYLTTYDDHVPLQAQLTALRQGKPPPRSKASGAVQAAVAANIAGTGWQALFYPKGRRTIFNIPNTDGTFDQHVQNMASADVPWSRFKNMNASCWGLFNNNLYFGAAGGKVFQADIGNLDNLGVIQANGQQAWNRFKSPLRKRLTAAKPVVQTAGGPQFTFAVGFDYGAINIPTAVSTEVDGSPWDTSPWDISPWSSETVVSTLWHAAGGDGVSVGWSISIPSNRATQWLRTDFRGEIGVGL